MAKIIPKLNLNRTPQTVDNYSLVAAKNIKLNKDNSFSRDTGIQTIKETPGLVGCISYNTKLYLFYNTDVIIEYDEVTNIERTIDCAWKYSGGIIDGKVIVNLRGETLLVINEYNEDDSNPLNVPVKIINLDKCSATDDESIYTQTPKLQLFDLIHVRDYTEPIQAGVYTFFGRYEIKDGFYTNWFPVSKPLYAGQKKLVNTIQGSVEYVDEEVNCGVSFVFDVVRPDKSLVIDNYKYLQIGFILKTNAGEVARSWKKFPINIETIHFDNKKEYIQEIDINDFFKPIYNNYNVKNLTTFKHKTYISNYVETDANPDLKKYAEDIQIEIKTGNLKNQQSKLYNNKTTVTNELSVTKVSENGINHVDTDVIVELDGVSFSDSFKNYYFAHNKINNQIIRNNGFLRITSDGTTLTDTTKTYIADNVGDTTNVIFSLLGQYNRDLETSSAYSKDYSEYFPNTVPTAVASYFPKEEGRNTVNLWYINSLTLELPNTTTTILDLLANVKSDRKATNINGECGLYTNDINNEIVNILSNYIVGITTEDEVIIKITQDNVTNYYNLNDCNLNIVYTHSAITSTLNDNATAGGKWSGSFTVTESYLYDIQLHLNPNNNLFFSPTNLVRSNITTLIPEQQYNFYIHFVKATGETTNGYFIGNAKIALTVDNAAAIEDHNYFYPHFINHISSEGKIDLKTKGYNYYFISCIKNNTTVECTGTQCLEFDLLLNRSDKVDVSVLTGDGVVVEPGIYMDDNGTSDNSLKYFGSGGYLVYENAGPAFIINDYELHEKELSLTKVTPYTNIDDSIQLSNIYFNCLGYLCFYSKPTIDDTKKYISSATIYEKIVEHETITLKTVYGSHPIKSTTERVIYSNYNLNFLRLSVSIQEQIRMYENSAEDTEQHKELTKFINSASLKDLYAVSSSYKDYTTYNYFNYNPDNNKYKFDNTIRSSSLRGDEANTFILQFDAENYYNVPTNKGIVIKLVGIGDTMLVHTQDSIFEFSGKPSIASDSAAQIVETDIFDSGITEVIPSEYGLAGLQHKKHALVTPFGYVFWDAQINTIYYYAGRGQIAPISDPIRKILDSFNPNNVNLSYDYVNDRFFINFVNSNDQSINLSYNIKAKAFVSFHDFAYDYSVNTKNKTYYIKGNIIGVISNTKSYDDFYTKSAYVIHKDENEHQGIYSYIDILINTEYEKIKTLDSITWICSAITDLQKTPTEYDNLAEDVSENPYPGNRMIIYSDTCVSNPITLQSSTLRTIKDYTKGDYKSPVYNLGKFTVNYFRNVKLGTNVEQTLMYGKYFGIRIFFDTNAHTNDFDDFKLENIELLYTLENYGKM